jgi:hypothetical protein
LRRRKTAVQFRLLAVFLACLFVLGGCSEERTIEQQIIAVIRDMEAHIENGERRPFMQRVAEDFSGQNGVMNKQQVNAIVLYQLHRNQRVHAQLLPVHVTSDSPDLAEAKFSALVTGGPGLLPDQGQKFEFHTFWQRRDGEWKLVKADWDPNVFDY